ncbi:MAG: AMP-binding protein, partial [Polymorphobacter sp.]
RQPGANPTDADRLAPLRLSHPAYVIYTSGSTGRPKGVVVEHRSVSDYLAWTASAHPAARGMALLHSPLSFDLTVTALWTPLVAGGCVRVAALEDAPAPGLPPHRFLKATPSHLPLLVALSGELEFAPDAELIERINDQYIGAETLMDGGVLTLGARNVIDCDVAEFEYNFLEYKIKTGANLPLRAVAAVPKARAIMQQIAKDYHFGRFHFSEYDPVYHPRATSHPMRTTVSLWRAHIGEDTAHPTWSNITGNDLIRNHATSGNSLRVLEAGMLFLAPRPTSYNRFDARNPAAPLYFYVKNRDFVHGETGRGVLGFAGEREMTYRIENRIPCQDTRPAVAAVVTLLSMSAGLEGAITFTQEKGDMPIGKDELDHYDASRPIPKNRKDAMASGKPGSGNACFGEMKRVVGKELTNDFYKCFSSFLMKMDAHDELLRTEHEEQKTKDVSAAQRLDMQLAVAHLRQLAIHGYSKREEAKPAVRVGAPETVMPDAVKAKLDASLERFAPYIEDYYQIFTRLREDVFELNESERKDAFLLRDVGNKRAGQLVACFDRTWDYLYEEEQLVGSASRQFKMDDMSRIQRIVQYVCQLVTQQTMGDLVREQDWP